MKKIYALLFALSMMASAHASHLMGGEILARSIGNNSYEVLLVIYRDTLGIPVAQTATLDVYDSQGNIAFSQTMNLDTVYSGTLLPTSAYGVEIYGYFDTLTFPGPDTYSLTWSTCCRNAAILNLSQPGSESMWLKTELMVDTSNNSTPVFLTTPVLVVPADTVWTHNPLPFDADGDSLVWSLDTPMNMNGQACAGYTLPPSDSAGPFSMDPITGTISWDPAALGNYVTSILVEEYRNGVKIGEIRRDLQFIVVPDSSSLRIANIAQIPTDQNGHYRLDMTTDAPMSFDLVASSDVNTEMDAYGAIFEFDSNPAVFSKTYTDLGKTVTGNISWVPTADQASDEPYIVVYRVNDKTFSFDLSILYHVHERGVGMEETKMDPVKIFPNPSTEGIYLELPEGQTLVNIYSLDGKLMKSTQLNSQVGPRYLQHDLPSGTYVVEFNQGFRSVKTTMVVL